jgi:hypothetical protein
VLGGRRDEDGEGCRCLGMGNFVNQPHFYKKVWFTRSGDGMGHGECHKNNYAAAGITKFYTALIVLQKLQHVLCKAADTD